MAGEGENQLAEVVTVSPSGEYEEIGKQLRQPSIHWTGPVDGMDPNDKWVRQPSQSEMPHLGKPLDEYYKNFFHEAFVKLKQALEGIQ